jgi:hypothetical protein
MVWRIAMITGLHTSRITNNGLYVTAFMKTVPVQFLVDSGSTLTLISYNLFMKMCTDKELKLQKNDCQIKDANDKNFKTYGTAQMKILFCDKVQFS